MIISKERRVEDMKFKYTNSKFGGGYGLTNFLVIQEPKIDANVTISFSGYVFSNVTEVTL